MTSKPTKNTVKRGKTCQILPTTSGFSEPSIRVRVKFGHDKFQKQPEYKHRVIRRKSLLEYNKRRYL